MYYYKLCIKPTQFLFKVLKANNLMQIAIVCHVFFRILELGPTLLFVKVNQGKEETRKFYACSACRDRKDCNFFQWEDEKV